MNENTMVNTDQLLCNVRRCKELPIEARHTICLEISKKRRQRVASRTSVFIPKELSCINYRKMFQRYEKNLSTSKKKFKSRLLNSRGFNKKLGALKNTTNRITKYNQNTKLKNQPKKQNHNRQNHQKNQQQTQKRRLKQQQQHKLTHPESYIIPQKLSPILIRERIRSAVKNLRKDVSSTKLFATSNNKQLVEQQIQLGTDQNFTISYTVEMPTDNRPPQTQKSSPGKTISIPDELPGANNVIDNSKLAPTQKSYLEIIDSDQFIGNELLEATKGDDYACVPIPDNNNRTIDNYNNNNSTIDNYNNNNSTIDNYNNNNSIIYNYNNCNNNNNTNNANYYSSSNNNINRDRSPNNNNNNNNKTNSEPISSNCYDQHQQVSSMERSFPNSEFENWNYNAYKAPEINQANLTAAMEQLQLAQVSPTNLSTSVTSRENVVHHNTMSSTIPSPATAYSNFVAQEKEFSGQNMFGFYQADPRTPRSSDADDDYPGSYSNIMDQRFVQHPNYQQHIDSLCYDHSLSGGTCNMPSNRNRCSSNVTINNTAKKERRKRPKINYACQSHRLHEDNNCEADSTTPLNTNTNPSWSRHLVNGESLGRLSKVMDLASTNDEESVDIATMYKQQQHQLHYQQNSIHHPAIDYHQQQSIPHPAVYQQQQQQQPILHPVALHPTVHHPVALHPIVHHPVDHHPIVHHPTVHHPIVHHPVDHYPAVHLPTPHHPAVHHLAVHHPAVHYPTLHHQQLQPILHPALYHQQQLQHPILLHQQQSDVLNQQSVLQPALHHQQQQQDKQIPFLYYQQHFEERVHHNHNQQQYHQLSLLHQQLIHYAADKFAATYPTQVTYPAPDPPSSGVSDPRHYYQQLSLDNGCCCTNTVPVHYTK